MAECTKFPVSINTKPKIFCCFTLNRANDVSFSCNLKYSHYSLNNRDCVTDDILLVSRFHCEQHQYLRKRIVSPLSSLLQNHLASSYPPSSPPRISSQHPPRIPKIFVLFSSLLVAGSLWNNVVVVVVVVATNVFPLSSSVFHPGLSLVVTFVTIIHCIGFVHSQPNPLVSGVSLSFL